MILEIYSLGFIGKKLYETLYTIKSMASGFTYYSFVFQFSPYPKFQFVVMETQAASGASSMSSGLRNLEVDHGCIIPCTKLPGALNSFSYFQGGRCSGDVTAPTSGESGQLGGGQLCMGSIIICTKLQLAKLGRCLVTPFMALSGL